MLSNYKRINILKEVEFANDFNLVSSLLLKWQKEQNLENIDEAVRALAKIGLFVNNMIMEQDLVEKWMSENKSDRNRAIERAREADKKLEEAEQLLKDYKKVYG